MTNTINVPRELLERLRSYIPNGDGYNSQYANDLADAAEAIERLSDQSPAGVDGLEVIGWYTDDHLDDKSATTYSREVADRWLAKGWPVTGIANAADAKAIIDGLRGEVADLRSMLATVSKAGLRVRTERDQHAQRIGELEGLLREVNDTYRAAIHWEDLRGTMKRIDAAMSAGKDSEQ